MKKHHYTIFVLSLIAVTLEALPGGAVLIFSDGVDTYQETFSYFSMTPFGYANFGPLLTAIATCVLLALSLFGLIRGTGLGAVRIVSGIAVVTSLMPLMFGFRYFTHTGFAIFAMLATAFLLSVKPSLLEQYFSCSCC